MTATTTDRQGLGYERVFVALDGSDKQGRVLARAIQVAQSDGAELYVGYVVDTTALEDAAVSPAELADALERAFRESVADDLARAEASGALKRVEIIVGRGRIRETLQDDMLDVVHPDLVVCGARGLSSIKYAILGSISTFLARTTDCDTLIVK